MTDNKPNENTSRDDDHHYNIVINGSAEAVNGKQIGYERIVHLAFPDGPHGGNVRYTVNYSFTDGRNGGLMQGQHVELAEGMMFDVDNTDKS